MKITEQTKKILENYSTINDSIVIQATKDGETSTPVRICDKHKMVLAQTLISEPIANDVCLHDLKAFLSTLSVLTNPEITLGADHLVITDDNKSSIRIVYGDASIVTQLTKKIELASASVKFTLKAAQLDKLMKLSGILALPDLKLFSDNGTLKFQVLDRKNGSTNSSTEEVGAGDTSGREIYFQRELLKMIPGDYQVEIAEKAAKFKSLDHENLEYIIALAV